MEDYSASGHNDGLLNRDLFLEKKKYFFDFWLASSFEFEKIDEIGGDVSLKIFTKWWWLSDVELKALTDETTGEIVFEEENTRAFPVNPVMPFLNLVVIEKLEQLSQAKCEKLPEDSPARKVKMATGSNAKYLVQAQKVYRATIRTQLDMRNYPFDRHLIAAILAVRKRKENGKSYKWRLLKTIPKNWFSEGDLYPEDEHIVSLQCQWLDPADELQSVLPCVEYRRVDLEGNVFKVGRPALCLRLERDPNFAIFNIVFPTFVIVSVVVLTFFVGWQFDERMVSVSTGLLTLVTLQLFLTDKLPKKCYTTYASKYWIAVYFFLLLLGLKILLVSSFLQDKSPLFVFSNVTASEISAKQLDVITTIFFLVIWVIPHLFILLDYIDIYRGFRERLRIPWGKTHVPAESWKFGMNDDEFLYENEDETEEDPTSSLHNRLRQRLYIKARRIKLSISE